MLTFTQQVNPAAIDDSACDAIIAAQGFTTLNKSLGRLWADHTIKEGIDWSERIRPASETVQATFLRAIYSKRQLVEVLAQLPAQPLQRLWLGQLEREHVGAL